MYQENNIKAKKRFGQNFLVSKEVVDKIIELVKYENKNILEIGPGTGALTKYLSKWADNFFAFEIDKDMQKYLLDNNILDEEQLIKTDFLDVNLDEYKNYVIVGNIPYNITSNILFKLFDNRMNFKTAILMVQEEVANRLVAKVNTNEYSKLTLTANYIATITKEFKVDKKLFSPIPKVNSAVIKIVFKQEKNDNYEKMKDFFKLCFLARRKKLSFSLKQKYSIINIENAYKKNNFVESIRIQQLSLEQIINLFNDLEKGKQCI
ncbi:16S rRNA (adenine(1518)-N(6)/adenine(1519)-N(6))-dimethyltransferase RsmA [Mycoplasmopsis meleagridis]|uniref:16S rRNA (adenine(1518)-N(6)/adenine(1519)-N(6))- dimethyltransferase RsmA n=1 Tax=Mycoplasmopsis meleagridis TaxID=29561 RepID=UPI003A87C940